MLSLRIDGIGACSLSVQRLAPRVETIAAVNLVELGAQLLVGQRHVIQLLPLLDGPPAHVLHGHAERVGFAFARTPIAYLRHVVEPFIQPGRVVVLTELDLEWLQGCSQLISLQANPALFRNKPQAFLAREESAIVQSPLEVCYSAEQID